MQNNQVKNIYLKSLLRKIQINKIIIIISCWPTREQNCVDWLRLCLSIGTSMMYTLFFCYEYCVKWLVLYILTYIFNRSHTFKTFYSHVPYLQHSQRHTLHRKFMNELQTSTRWTDLLLLCGHSTFISLIFIVLLLSF